MEPQYSEYIRTDIIFQLFTYIAFFTCEKAYAIMITQPNYFKEVSLYLQTQAVGNGTIDWLINRSRACDISSFSIITDELLRRIITMYATNVSKTKRSQREEGK